MPARKTLRRRTFLALGLWPLAIASQSGFSQTAPATAEDEVILTLSGLDPAQAPDGVLRLDRKALAAFGPVTFTTSSIWTEGKHSFTGIPLMTLARSLNLPPETIITLQALNDYQVDIPLSEITEEAPILAYEMDGKIMPVRGKGPIWVVYPYDADPKAYQTVTVFARSVWQLDRIRFSR